MPKAQTTSTIRILLFEDRDDDRKSYMKAFSGHDVALKFMPNPKTDWNVTRSRAMKIVEFNPDLIVVDLMNDTNGEEEAGIRTIRQLKDGPLTKHIPVVACSVLFRPTEDGRKVRERAEGMGAFAIFKSRQNFPKANQFLSYLGS